MRHRIHALDLLENRVLHPPPPVDRAPPSAGWFGRERDDRQRILEVVHGGSRQSIDRRGSLRLQAAREVADQVQRRLGLLVQQSEQFVAAEEDRSGRQPGGRGRGAGASSAPSSHQKSSGSDRRQHARASVAFSRPLDLPAPGIHEGESIAGIPRRKITAPTGKFHRCPTAFRARRSSSRTQMNRNTDGVDLSAEGNGGAHTQVTRERGFPQPIVWITLTMGRKRAATTVPTAPAIPTISAGSSKAVNVSAARSTSVS